MAGVNLSITTRTHPKIKKLEIQLGANGVLALYNLWCFCAEYKKDGILSGMSCGEIVLASDFRGPPEVFMETLLECRLLDRDEDLVYSVHNWEKYNKKRRKTSQSPDNTTKAVAYNVQKVVNFYESNVPRIGNKVIVPGSDDWKRIKKALAEGFSLEDLIAAIKGNLICPWHQRCPGGHSVKMIFKPDKIQGFIERANEPEKFEEKKEEQVGHHKGSKEFNDGDQAKAF
jgi:hypothetical protein|tara:strand:+ start:191 stop:877 length:687 start_codon:yes stop_codon:yes gene_type:complete